MRRSYHATWRRLRPLPILFTLACSGFASNPLHLFKPRPDTQWRRLVPELAPAAKLGTWAHLDLDDFFEDVPLGLSSPPCFWVDNWVRDRAGPVLFLVHGIDGVARDWDEVLPTLTRLAPAAVFLYDWSPYEQRDTLAEGLAIGVSRVAQCLGERGGPLVVLAHSAGGVLAALAASRILVPAVSHPGANQNEPRVTIVTVAAPLAGFGDKQPAEDGSSEFTFLVDLGSSFVEYPPAAPRVQVVHLRTQHPADLVMKPGVAGHLPNQRGVGVAGALEVDLPDTWGHTSSLRRVADAMAELRWLPWRDLGGAQEALAHGHTNTPDAGRILGPPHTCVLREEVLRRGEPFTYVDPDERVPKDRVPYWDGSSLPETMPPADTYVRCRPCDCDGGALRPWGGWEEINRRAYAKLRGQRAPYPVVIVPGFPDAWVMRSRLGDALLLLKNGWAAALLLSGGHQPIGGNWSRWMVDEAVRIAQEEHDFDVVDRIFVEPCATESLTHLRNSLRMMGALGLDHGLLLLDDKMSMQAMTFYSQLEGRVPEELRCPVGRVSYLYGDGPRPRLGQQSTGCHPFLTWRSNPIGYFLSARQPAIFWVSPKSYGTSPGGEVAYDATACFGGVGDVVLHEPDNQDPWKSECVPAINGKKPGECAALRH